MNKYISRIILFALFQCAISVNAQTLIIVTQQETGMYNQTFFTSGIGNQLQEENIKKYWNEDFYINTVAYTSYGWFVSMAKGFKWTNQSYSYSTSWPDEWIHEKFNEGYRVTSLTSSGDKWMIVMSEHTDYVTQEICSAPWSTLKDWIRKWWDNDYYITSLTCRNGMWTVVMSKTSLYLDQSYVSSTTKDGIMDKVKTKWGEGFRIVAYEYGGGEYLCVLSKLANGTTPMQSYQIDSTDPTSFIKEKWNESYNVIYVGG